MHRRHSGQSLIEFALISMVFLLILAITVDFARAFSAHITIGNVARAGAQAGTISEFLGAESKAGAKQLIRNTALAEQSTIYGTSPEIDSRLCMDSAGYELVQVRVRHDFVPLIPIGPISGPFPLERHVELRAQMMNPEDVPFDDSCF
jgi:hypothetical protein